MTSESLRGSDLRFAIKLRDFMRSAATPFLTGFILSLALIVTIGAQNAYVLRQGLRRETWVWWWRCVRYSTWC